MKNQFRVIQTPGQGTQLAIGWPDFQDKKIALSTKILKM